MSNYNWGRTKGSKGLIRRLLSPSKIAPLIIVVVLISFIGIRVEIDWGKTMGFIGDTNPFWILVALISHYITFLFRGARWRVLLQNTDPLATQPEKLPSVLYYGRLILMGWFVNGITWFRLGDAYRAYAYSQDQKRSFPKTMGTILAERLVDLLVVLLLLAIGGISLYLGGRIQPSPLFLILGGGISLVGIGGLIAMYFMRRWISPRLPGSLQRIYEQFHTGTMGSFRNIPLLFLLGIMCWLAEMGRLIFVLKALNIQLSTGMMIFAPMANGLLSTIPITPGGLGIVETGLTGLLILELVREKAIAVALIDRSISYGSVLVTGGIIFTARQIRSARKSIDLDSEP